MAINIAIVDDHRMVTEGISNLLRSKDHFNIIALYATGEEAMEGLTQQQPDVLLLDIHLPDITGNELARSIGKTFPAINIIALTSVDNPYDIKDMMQHGCKGYLLKSATVDELVLAIEKVYSGEIYLEQNLKEKLVATMLKTEPAPPSKDYKLTQREITLIQLLSEGLTNDEIAERLYLSHRTIQNNRLLLYRKLGVKNTAALVKVGLQMGIL